MIGAKNRFTATVRIGLTAVLCAWSGVAAAASEYLVLRTGDTIESVAEQLGDARLAKQIRALNDIEPGDQPPVGTVIELPEVDGRRVCDQSTLVLAAIGDQNTARAVGATSTVPLREGTSVPPGTEICTGQGGFATVRLTTTQTGGVHDDINLLPGTCAVIASATSDATGRSSLVDLRSGSVYLQSTADDPGEVTVTTPSGVTFGRGGDFRVTVEDGSARTESLSSEASVMGAGAEVELGENQGTRVETGQAPQPPIDLLPPGYPIAPEPFAPLLRPDFSWSEVPRALGYRIQIAGDADFSAVLYQEDVPRALWEPSILLLPSRAEAYYWRVTAFDKLGFEGQASLPRPMVMPMGVGRR